MEQVGEKLRLGFVDDPDYSVLEAFRYIVSAQEYTDRIDEILKNPYYHSFLNKLQAAMPDPFDIERDEAKMLLDLANEYVEVFGITEHTPETVREIIESADAKWGLPDVEQTKMGIEELTSFIES